nr:translation initiation factor IF-2 N-terminal domain-containing protein [Nitratireductor sp.]
MSDTDGKKPLGLGGGRSGQVKQSFSHGRTHAVVVETKRKRVVVPQKPVSPAPSKPGAGGAAGDPSRRPAGISDAELERRMKALQAARAREVVEQAQRAEEERQREEERERRRAEIEAKEREERAREEALKAKAEEEARRQRDAEARAQRKEEIRKPAAAPARPDPAAAEAAATRAAAKGVPVGGPRKTDRERDDRAERDARSRAARDEGRRTGKLTLTEALDGEGGRQRSLAAMKRKQERARAKALGLSHRSEKQVRDVQLPETIVVQELANRMAERAADVVKSLMKMGMMVTMNQTIDADTAELVIEEFGHRAVRVSDADVEQVIDSVQDRSEDLQQRPPVVTIMGHVDHG